jgi:hypothetical protein
VESLFKLEANLMNKSSCRLQALGVTKFTSQVYDFGQTVILLDSLKYDLLLFYLFQTWIFLSNPTFFFLSNIVVSLKQHNNVTRFTATTDLNSVAPKTAAKSKLFILLVLERGLSLLS